MKITKSYLIIFLLSIVLSVELEKKPILNKERNLMGSLFSRTIDRFLKNKSHPKFTFNTRNLKIDDNINNEKARSLAVKHVKNLSNINFKKPDLNLDVLNGLENPIQERFELQNYDALKSITNLKKLNQILIQTNERAEAYNLVVSKDIDKNPIFNGCVANLSLEFKVMSNIVFYLKKSLMDILPEHIDFENKSEFVYGNLNSQETISEEKYEYIIKNGNLELYKTQYHLKIQQIIEFFKYENFDVFKKYSKELALVNFNRYYNYFKKEVKIFEKINRKLVMTITKAKPFPKNIEQNPFEKSVKKMIIDLKSKLEKHEKNEIKRFRSIENKMKSNNLNNLEISIDENGTYYAGSKKIGPNKSVSLNKLNNNNTNQKLFNATKENDNPLKNKNFIVKNTNQLILNANKENDIPLKDFNDEIKIKTETFKMPHQIEKENGTIFKKNEDIINVLDKNKAETSKLSDLTMKIDDIKKMLVENQAIGNKKDDIENISDELARKEIENETNLKKKDEDIINVLQNMKNETKGHKFENIIELLNKGLEVFEERHYKKLLSSPENLTETQALLKKVKSEIQNEKSLNKENLSVAGKLINEVKEEIEFEKNLVDDAELKKILENSSREDIDLFKKDVNDGIHFDHVSDFHNDIDLHMHSIDEIEGFDREQALKEFEKKHKNLNFDEKELISEEEESNKLKDIKRDIKDHEKILEDLSTDVKIIENDLNEEENILKVSNKNHDVVEGQVSTSLNENKTFFNKRKDLVGNLIKKEEDPLLESKRKNDLNVNQADTKVLEDNSSKNVLEEAVKKIQEGVEEKNSKNLDENLNQSVSIDQNSIKNNKINIDEDFSSNQLSAKVQNEKIVTTNAINLDQKNPTFMLNKIEHNEENISNIKTNLIQESVKNIQSVENVTNQINLINKPENILLPEVPEENDDDENKNKAVTFQSQPLVNNLNKKEGSTFVLNKMKDTIVNEKKDIDKLEVLNNEIGNETGNLFKELPKEDAKNNNTNIEELKELQNKIIEMTNELQNNLPSLIEEKQREENNIQNMNISKIEPPKKKAVINYFVDDRKKFEVDDRNKFNDVNENDENYHYPSINDFRLTSEFEKNENQEKNEKEFITNLMIKLAKENKNGLMNSSVKNKSQNHDNNFNVSFLKYMNKQRAPKDHYFGSMDPYKNRNKQKVFDLIKKEEPTLVDPIFDDIKKDNSNVLNEELLKDFDKDIPTDNFNHKISDYMKMDEAQNPQKLNPIKEMNPMELELQNIKNALNYHQIQELDESIPFEKK